jgi:hypothetical protein
VPDVHATFPRDRFQKRGFTGTVLAYKEYHPAFEGQFGRIAQDRDIEWIDPMGRVFVTVDPKLGDVHKSLRFTR